MEEISLLIARATAERAARAEKREAFGAIVRRFQDFAFACAYAVLGDFHLAEDAAQEAFLAAWRNLDQLREPAAFPGWLKRIVLSQCSRLTRGKQLATVVLETIAELPSNGADPSATKPASGAARRFLSIRAMISTSTLASHEASSCR